MKTRNSKVNKGTQTIIKLLKADARVADIQKKGYSKSTILYWKRKLFHPEKYERYLTRQLTYQTKNVLPRG